MRSSTAWHAWCAEPEESWTVFVHGKERVLLEEDLSGEEPEKSFVWGGRIDELLVEGVGSDIYAVHLDRLGSVVALTDEAGTLVETYE